MGQNHSQSVRKRKGSQPFASSFDEGRLPKNDPALQALKAHQELELNSDPFGQRLTRQGRKPPVSHLGPTQKTPVKIEGLAYQWQHHLTNFTFCLVFLGLGFMLSEIRQILQAQKVSSHQAWHGMEGPPPVSSSSNMAYYAVESPTLNVRQGPGVRFPIVEKLNRGAKIQASVVDERWLKIGDERYIYRPSVRAASSHAEPFLARVRVEKAPIRGGPGQGQALLGVYFRGKFVHVEAFEQGWARIGDGQYVSASNLERVVSDRLSGATSNTRHQKTR